MNPGSAQSIIDQAETQAAQNNLSSMVNQPAVNSTTQQAQDALQSSAPAAHAPQSTNHPNLIERLLPTIGGVLGGLGAGAADIVTGGAAIPFSAAIAGAGSALGKTAENEITHQGLGNGVLTSGLEGAAGQAGGALVGGLLGKAGTGLEKFGAANATKAAADTQTQATSQAGIDEATAIKNNFGGVKKEVQAANDMGKNQELLKGFGVDHTDPQAMNDAAKGGLFINDIDNEALGLGSPIKTTDLISSHDITSATPEEQQALVNAGIITPEGRMPATVTPQQANGFAQDINSQLRGTQATLNAATANGRAGDVNILKQQVNNLTNLYKNVQNVSATPEVNQAIAARVISPAEKQQLVTQFGQQEADHIEGAVNDAQTHQDLVKAKLPFAQMNSISNLALHDAQATATPGALARAKSGVATATAGNPLNADSALNLGSLYEGTLGHHPLALAAPLALKAAENPAVQQGVGSLIKSVGGSAAPGILGQVIGNSSNDVAAPAGTGNDVTLNQDMNQGTNPLQAQILAALAQYGNGGAGQLGGAIQAQQHVNEAQAAEQNLAQNFNQAGGAQGPLGGILSRLGATFTGGEAGQYAGQAQADAQTIAQATGVPLQEVEKSLPGLGENQSAAQASLGNLQSLIQALTQGNSPIGGIVGTTQR